MKLPDKRELMKEPISEFDKINAVLPSEIVVGVETDPESIVESQGMTVAHSLLRESAELTQDAASLDTLIGVNADLLADEDIKALKGVVSELKAAALTVQSLASTYDEAEMSDSARKAIKKLLRK